MRFRPLSVLSTFTELLGWQVHLANLIPTAGAPRNRRFSGRNQQGSGMTRRLLCRNGALCSPNCHTGPETTRRTGYPATEITEDTEYSFSFSVTSVLSVAILSSCGGRPPITELSRRDKSRNRHKKTLKAGTLRGRFRYAAQLALSIAGDSPMLTPGSRQIIARWQKTTTLAPILMRRAQSPRTATVMCGGGA